MKRIEAIEEKLAKIEKSFEVITSTVEKAVAQGENELASWTEVKRLLNDENSNMNFTEEEKEQLIKKVEERIAQEREKEEEKTRLENERIAQEKDELYFEQVKAFTNNFSFLRGEITTQIAEGRRPVKKFTDKESYMRFLELRSLLQVGNSEYLRIEQLLQNEDLSDVNKKILEERKVVIDKQIERRKGYGETEK